MKWNHLKAYCRKKHLRQFSGMKSQKGPGTHSKQRDFVSVTGPSLLRGDKLLEPNQELEQWNGMEETDFLFFKYSSTLSLSRAYKQTGVRANPCCSSTEMMVAVLCWGMGLRSMDMGSMELSMGWLALIGGRVTKGLGVSSWAPCWLGGISWLLVILPVSNTVSSPGALGNQRQF